MNTILTRKSCILLLLHKSGKSVTSEVLVVKFVEVLQYQSKCCMSAVRTSCRDHRPMYQTVFHNYDTSKESSVHSPALRLRIQPLASGRRSCQ